MAYPKQEGAPAHPDDFLWDCDCQDCQWKYERQLREWYDWNGLGPPRV